MDKIEVFETTIEHIKHKFYCDNCNEFLGESIEYEDGYYAEKGEYQHMVRIDKTWLQIDKILCPKCAEELTNKIINALKELGYE